MKLQHALIENFKGVKHCEIDFTSATGEPRWLTCLIGDNGSGKTTVLQAIALTLSLATRRTREATQFHWNGFLVERINNPATARVVLQVRLDDDEIKLSHKLYREWFDSRSIEWKQTNPSVEPSDRSEITLVYERGQVHSPQGRSALVQFLGKFHARSLPSRRPIHLIESRLLGDVYWFDQYRGLGSAYRNVESEQNEFANGGDAVEDWQSSVHELRQQLVNWWAYHKSPLANPENDLFALLETRLAQIFPGLMFDGVGLGSDLLPNQFFFLLQRDGKTFDLAELSSGEQAVFALLYEFVRLRIARSIILIDELELHLHPPQQQALLRALPRLGEDCQYIISTHSPFLADAIPDEEEVHLPGGSPCL
jgi:ABC-type lipoprotein export system ATPase subunit